MIRTYLYGYGDGPYGAHPTRRTREWIETRETWSRMHPEVLRRLFALADDVINDGGDFGFGTGYRSSSTQLTLFLSRYDHSPKYLAGYFWWDGRPQGFNHYGWWRRKPHVASAAPPGRSYHEPTTAAGQSLAADMVGDHSRARKFQAKHGLHDFSNVNNEPWHYQPVEIPNARASYTNQAEPLPRFPPKHDNPPHYITEDQMLYIAFPADNPTAGKWWNDDTPWLAVFESGVVRRAMNTDVAYADAVGIPKLPINSPEQHAYMVKRFPAETGR